MSFKCKVCRDEEGYFEKRTVQMTVQGELKDIEMDHWIDCSCKDGRHQERSFKSSKITPEFKKRDFESFNLDGRPQIVRDAYFFAKTYYENFQKIKDERQNSICLLGKAGSGKTHLLMAIINAIMESKYLYDVIRFPSVQYFPWVEGFNEIKDDLSMTEERIRRMQTVDLLFIDDMWKGRKDPTPFQIEQAFAVINYRYMNNKPVLISSERDIDQMCDIDEAIGSRINEMCKDFRIILKGDRSLNYRLREEAS